MGRGICFYILSFLQFIVSCSGSMSWLGPLTYVTFSLLVPSIISVFLLFYEHLTIILSVFFFFNLRCLDFIYFFLVFCSVLFVSCLVFFIACCFSLLKPCRVLQVLWTISLSALGLPSRHRKVFCTSVIKLNEWKGFIHA